MKRKKIIKPFILISIFFLMFTAKPVFANVENSKWITNYPTSYYDDGTYSGNLSKYLAGGQYIPPDSKNATKRVYGEGYSEWVCKYHPDQGWWAWTITYSYETNRGQTYYYNEGGYSGTLYRYNTVEYDDTGRPSTLMGPCNESLNGATGRQKQYFYADFSGTVYKPAVDTRYYRYQGYVYAAVEDPSGSHNYGGNTGGVDGEFTWKLEKPSDTGNSQIRLINNARITGNHYATRNPQYSIQSNGVISKTSNSPINIVVNNPNDLKNKDITFTFSYEYTNYYRDIYTCSAYNDKGCISWSFSRRIPDWDKVQKATRTETLKADHKYGELVEVSGDTSKKLIVGRSAKLSGTSISTEVLNETFNIDATNTTLQSQNWIPINEEIKYSSDLNNKLYVRDGEKWYFPDDIDDNLKEKYKNKTDFDYSDYAIKLRVGNQTNKSVTFNTADNFYLTENTGFLFSLPVSVDDISTINKTAKQEYEAYTGQTYDDEVLTTSEEGSRYYLNIDGNGEQKPNTWYDNPYVIGKLGLSDITFHLKEKVQFKQYLLGNSVDKPLINEQQETVLDNVTYTHSVTVSPDQMKSIKNIAKDRAKLLFGFRSTDIKEKYNQLQQILPSLSY